MAFWTDDLDQLDVLRFARSIERACQDGVKWELRRLNLIREEHPQKQSEELAEQEIAASNAA